MDCAYEDNETRALALKRGLISVVHPEKKLSWHYDAKFYKRRNKVKRLSLCIKRFRKVFTRYDRLDTIYFSIVTLVLLF